MKWCVPNALVIYVCSVTQSCLTLCSPMEQRLLCPWDFPGKNAEVGCHFLLQDIFPTQGSNLRLLLWQGDSLPLSHLGSPQKLIINMNYFYKVFLGLRWLFGKSKNTQIVFFSFVWLQNSSESHSCARSLLMADRMQIVVILSEFFNSTWQKANCASK